MKTIKDILYKVSVEGVLGTTSNTVSGIYFDSRDVKLDSLYVAQKGELLDGHDFISQAIDNGAKTIVCEEFPIVLVDGIVYVLVLNSSEALGTIASNFYDNPSEKMILVGVTGTNGKTTIATLLYELFLREGFMTGLLSTVKIAYGYKKFENYHTTPDAVTLNKYLHKMLDAGVSHCFMEVSSHGIDQNRIKGLVFSGGIFSNLSHDHLDYHQNFKTYRDVKKLFFDSLPKTAFALVNLDDKNGKYMLQNSVAKKYTYAIKQHADFKAQTLECEFTGMLLKIQSFEVWTTLVGNFNAQNLLSVYAAADLLGLSSLSILKGISELKNVEGRFYVFQSENNITVVIDYAHTPDALFNVLSTINIIRTRNENLITVVGCGGNRDQEKRPMMGEKAVLLSDKVIFTSDNPRDEDPAIIIEDMIKGVPPEHYKKTIKVILREEAIIMAGQLAKPGDIVLIAGKGHEQYQEIKGKRNHFSDLEIAKNYFLNKN
jgi:UDP-N-acetylmuramoyl-L-alanyl-D-glutamate--2,6-diaminopimelate ligase